VNIRGLAGLFALLLVSSPLYAEETLQTWLATFRYEQQPKKMREALVTLSHANIQPLGLPCNGLNCLNSRLDVVNLDDVLLVLGQWWSAYPEQRRDIERIVLRWNFCDVNYLNVPHNLVRIGASQGISRQAVGRAIGWPGLRLWGFTEKDPKYFIQPELLTRSDLDARSKRQLFYRVERQQCFPNPANGQTPFDPETLPYDTFYRYIPNDPVLWLQAMPTKTKLKEKAQVKVTPKILAPKKIIGVKKQLQKHFKAEGYSYQSRHSRSSSMLPNWSAYHLVYAQGALISTSLKPVYQGVTPSSINKPATLTRLSADGLIMAVKLSQQSSGEGLHWVESLDQSQGKFEKMQAPSADALVSNGDFFTRSPIYGYDNLPLPASPNVGLTGDVQLRWRLKDNSYAFNTSAQWSPYKNFYVRGGLKIPVLGVNRTSTYTWGFGYADWKPGGFSLGWNQWSPQTLNTPPSLKNMEFKFGYNLSLMQLLSLPKRYQSNVSFSYSGGVPALHNDWQYNFGDGWFARVGVSKQFARNKRYHRNDWGWTYGFGRSKWQAGSFNIEYANWGFNRIPQDNFRLNGEVIATWRWKLPW